MSWWQRDCVAHAVDASSTVLHAMWKGWTDGLDASDASNSGSAEAGLLWRAAAQRHPDDSVVSACRLSKAYRPKQKASLATVLNGKPAQMSLAVHASARHNLHPRRLYPSRSTMSPIRLARRQRRSHTAVLIAQGIHHCQPIAVGTGFA